MSRGDWRGRLLGACGAALGAAATCCSITTSFDGLTSDATSTPDDGGAPTFDARPPDDALGAGPLDATQGAPLPDEDAATDDAPSFDAAVDTGADSPAPLTGYRRTITVANGASSPLPAGSLVRVDIDLAALAAAGKAKADGSDMRIESGTTEIDRVLDPGGTIWFATTASIPSGGTDAVYSIEYGTTGKAPPRADGTKVFTIDDEFDGTALAPTWNVQGSPTVAGGLLTLHGGSDQGITTVASADRLPAASAVEIVARVTNPASAPDPSTGFFYWIGYQHTGDFNATKPWIKWIARAPGTVQAEDNDDCSVASCTGPAVPQTTAFRTYRIERASDATRFYLDGALQTTAPTSNVDDLSVMVRNLCVTSDLIVDRARAWAFVTPPPTSSLGPEQPAP